MKIVVKHSDILRGELKDTPLNEYLVYLYNDTNQPVRCDMAYGEMDRDFKIDFINLTWNSTDYKNGIRLPMEEITYKEFKELNEV